MLQSEGMILGVEDLRESSSTFLPALKSEVLKDQHALHTILENLVGSPSHDTKIQCLAKYLLDNLKFISASGVNRLARSGISNALMWVTDTETQGTWYIKGFVGSGSGAQGVLDTEWLGIPCAKKIFKAQNPECADFQAIQGTLGYLAAAVSLSAKWFGIQSIKNEVGKQMEDIAFRKEVALLARLNHPNVVKFFCCGSDSKDECFIGMELMEMDMSSLITSRTRKPFAIEVALDIIVQIARGMLYLHDLGIAHRDLKPLNVVISKAPNSPYLVESFCVKLIDFGLSKAKIQASMSSTVSIPNCGTVAYRAPEVFSKAHEHVLRRGEQKVNWFKADVYSFALTCSVILSLKKPFEGRAFEVWEEDDLYLELIRGVRPKLPSTCPKELTALLEECWETNPERRPHFSTICATLEKYKHRLLRSLRASMDEGLAEVNDDATSNCNTCIERILEERSRHRSSLKDFATASSVNEAVGIGKAIMMIPYYVGREILLNGWKLSSNIPTWFRQLYKSVGADASLSSLEAQYSSLVLDYTLLSAQCMQDIAQVQRVGHATLLNRRQCQQLSSVFVQCVKNIQKLMSDFGASNVESFRPGLWNFYVISVKLRRLVTQCFEEDWCRAAVFQIRNEVAFREMLVDIAFYYNVIFDKAKSLSNEEWKISEVEVLRRSLTFSPTSEDEIFEDRRTLKNRLENMESSGSSDEHKRCLARYLLGRLEFIYEERRLERGDLGFASLELEGSQEFVSTPVFESMVWKTKEEPPGTWSNQRIFSSHNNGAVLSTKWLSIPCAKAIWRVGNVKAFMWKESYVRASLHHPNIVKFFCCGNDEREGQFFIGMELMDMDLAKFINIQEGKPFPIVVALDIIVQIARGMYYLHSEGIAHRDLKPCNVLISRALNTTELGDILCVKLTDFGICKVNVEANRAEVPTGEFVFGTVGYMAPEVYRRRDSPLKAFKTDIFSFGMICSDILSFNWSRPLSFREYSTTLEEGARPKPPSGCPTELVALLKECWDADPEL